MGFAGGSFLFSLRSRLIALILMAVLPGFLLTLFFANVQRTAALRAVEAQNLSTLRLAALSQAQIIANTKGLFSTLIVASEIRSRNVDGCNVLLDYILQTSTEYRGFAISSLEGKTWCATANLRASLINTTTASPPGGVSDMLYQRALAQKGFVVGDFVIGNVSGRPNLTFAQPIYDERGQAVAMLTAGLDLDQLNQSISNLQLRRGTWWIFWIAMARLWCAGPRPRITWAKPLAMRRSPGKFCKMAAAGKSLQARWKA